MDKKEKQNKKSWVDRMILMCLTSCFMIMNVSHMILSTKERVSHDDPIMQSFQPIRES
ncbi:transmembrane protein, putative [Medicago truncatula]|uniref:Transmembrane protein, putative n=1 Tax=Medicago truncatula TaxID=3880 RepID=G7IP89_MEDTR|nr:transmembrane protein, putative [Medicago truncatula]